MTVRVRTLGSQPAVARRENLLVCTTRLSKCDFQISRWGYAGYGSFYGKILVLSERLEGWCARDSACESLVAMSTTTYRDLFLRDSGVLVFGSSFLSFFTLE